MIQQTETAPSRWSYSLNIPPPLQSSRLRTGSEPVGGVWCCPLSTRPLVSCRLALRYLELERAEARTPLTPSVVVLASSYASGFGGYNKLLKDNTELAVESCSCQNKTEYSMFHSHGINQLFLDVSSYVSVLP